MQDFYNVLSVAKVFAAAMGNSQITISQEERNAAFKCLKDLADQRDDWTQEQRDYYKLMVDFGDDITKQ